jgi:hypothetical protein
MTLSGSTLQVRGTKRGVLMHWSLAIQAEPSPRAYLQVSIQRGYGRCWTAHSHWVPLTRALVQRTPKEETDGEAGDQS